ncbi:MAG TPA: ATP-binding cassette domain-containing protein [Thermoanaerobaculia bacterium]|jgi:molybdate transport system ATP-binding protein
MSVHVDRIALPLAHFELDVTAELTARATAITGPSGAGKTSLLELIAGLRQPTRGSISIHDRPVFDRERRIDVPARSRRVGYVPQDDALFPHLSVRRNIVYSGASAAYDDVVSVLEIGHVLDRGVQHLSGGERKRVALARALLSRPAVLLLDEPLAGVDPELRRRVLDYLVRVRDEFPIPIVYVTHDPEEAAHICDEAVVLERGRVVGRMVL